MTLVLVNIPSVSDADLANVNRIAEEVQADTLVGIHLGMKAVPQFVALANRMRLPTLVVESDRAARAALEQNMWLNTYPIRGREYLEANVILAGVVNNDFDRATYAKGGHLRESKTGFRCYHLDRLTDKRGRCLLVLGDAAAETAARGRSDLYAFTESAVRKAANRKDLDQTLFPIANFIL